MRTPADKEIYGELRVLLNPLGFLQRHGTFTRTLTGIKWIIQVQKSNRAGRDSLFRVTPIYTINLGIYSDVIGRARKEVIQSPGAVNAHWRERIGSLFPERTDKWWRLRWEEDARTIGKDMAMAVERFALPLFRRIQTTDDLLNYWLNDGDGVLSPLQRDTYITYLQQH